MNLALKLHEAAQMVVTAKCGFAQVCSDAAAIYQKRKTVTKAWHLLFALFSNRLVRMQTHFKE